MCIDRCLVGAALLVVVACTSSSAPTASTPLSAPSASSGVVPGRIVSGVVAEGAQPIAGAQIDNGPGSWVLSDANGAFQFPATQSIDPHAWVRASKDGYAQPCAAPIADTGPVAVQMVPLSALNSVPLPSPAGFRTISGVVTMTTSAGTWPAVGVWVDFEPSLADDWPAAFTHTDSNGKFSLCTLPETAVNIGALLGNMFAYVTVPPGQTNIELTLDSLGVDGKRR